MIYAVCRCFSSLCWLLELVTWCTRGDSSPCTRARSKIAASWLTRLIKQRACPKAGTKRLIHKLKHKAGSIHPSSRVRCRKDPHPEDEQALQTQTPIQCCLQTEIYKKVCVCVCVSTDGKACFVQREFVELNNVFTGIISGNSIKDCIFHKNAMHVHLWC